MKRIQNVFQRLAVCVLAIATVTSAVAQSATPGAAKVVRIKGPARYTTGNNVWLPLKTGAMLKPGTLIQTYDVPGEHDFWLGLDLVGDGTFWAANYETSNVYRFDLTSGTVLAGFNAGTPPHTVVGVRVKK